VFAWAQRAGGLQGLMGLDLGLTVLILFALYALATLRSGNSKGAFVVLVVLLPLTYPSLTMRPQMLGYLFLVITLIVLERFRQGDTRWVWVLPPIFLAWVNIHGSFVVGLFALGVYWAGGLIRLEWGNVQSRLWTPAERTRLELIALLILVALTITPYGTQVCVYPLDMAFAQPINVENIQEWQAMGFSYVYGKVFLAMILGFIVAQVTLRPAWRLEELFLALIGITGACLHVRFVMLFVPFCVPLFSVIAARAFSPYDAENDKYPLNAVMIAGIIGAIAWYFPSKTEMKTLVEEKWPVKAVAYLRQHPVPQPMYNTYGYGGFLIWEASDFNKVFIDGRADIYERSGVLSDYLTISRLGVPTPALLDAYRVQSCLVTHDEAIRTYLEASPQWHRVYSDTLSALFVRAAAAPKQVAP
jgi:hypothetical protein